jgi:hypothetical protein
MTISPFFRNLRTAYYAEIDDLTFDSEGKNVLANRLKQRRTEIGFLISMLELSPEMVAVVFHKAFTFKTAGAMDRVLRQSDDKVPEWATLANAVSVAPWAQDILQAILKQPKGAWFMSVAAGLEFLYSQPQGLPAGDSEDEDDTQDDDGNQRQRNLDSDNDDRGQDHDDDEADRTREEAGADWLADKGFDRKD